MAVPVALPNQTAQTMGTQREYDVLSLLPFMGRIERGFDLDAILL